VTPRCADLGEPVAGFTYTTYTRSIQLSSTVVMKSNANGNAVHMSSV
jgi:hypothetical protein